MAITTTAPSVAINIDAYGTYARQSALADYMEVAAIVGKSVTQAALARAIESNGWASLPRRQFLTVDNFDEDPGAWAESVFGLIRERIQLLNDKYPFEQHRTSIRLRIDRSEIRNSPYLALLAIAVLHAWKLSGIVATRLDEALESLVARVLESRGLTVSRMGAHERAHGSFVTSVVEGGKLLGLEPMTNPLPRKTSTKDAGVDTLAGLTWADGRAGGQWLFIGQATVGESTTWVRKLNEPEPGLWAGYMQEPLDPQAFLAVPHHVDGDHLAHMTTSRRGLVLDRLRLCLSMNSTSPGERELVEALAQVVVE